MNSETPFYTEIEEFLCDYKQNKLVTVSKILFLFTTKYSLMEKECRDYVSRSVLKTFINVGKEVFEDQKDARIFLENMLADWLEEL